MRDKFKIKHPGTGEVIICDGFNAATEYFEGFNLPYKVLESGELESFKTAYMRVEKWLEDVRTNG